MDTIRNHLNGLSLSKLRQLTRIHNKLYNIKIGQTKQELIDALVIQYETMTGTHMIHRQPDKLNLIIPKQVRKPKKPKEREPVPVPVFIKATPALKEKLRAYREAKAIRLARDDNEKKYYKQYRNHIDNEIAEPTQKDILSRAAKKIRDTVYEYDF